MGIARLKGLECSSDTDANKKRDALIDLRMHDWKAELLPSQKLVNVEITTAKDGLEITCRYLSGDSACATFSLRGDSDFYDLGDRICRYLKWQDVRFRNDDGSKVEGRLYLKPDGRVSKTKIVVAGEVVPKASSMGEEIDMLRRSQADMWKDAMNYEDQLRKSRKRRQRKTGGQKKQRSRDGWDEKVLSQASKKRQQ